MYHLYRVYVKVKTGVSSLWVNLIHIFMIAPLLAYIGYYKKEASGATFDMLLLLAFSGFGYHIYRVILLLNTVTGGK